MFTSSEAALSSSSSTNFGFGRRRLLTQPAASAAGPLVSLVFRMARAATGIDVASALYGYAKQGLGTVPKQKPQDALRCMYTDAVQCTNRRSPLVYETALYWLAVVALLAGLRIVKLGSLSVAVLPLAFFLALPVIFHNAYGLPFGCSISLTPALPVCFVPDVQEAVYALLPRHLPWPSPLVERAPSGLKVLDCKALGFGDGILEIVYYLDLWVPSWRLYVSSFTTSTWLGFGPEQEVNYWNGKAVQSHAYEQCAGLFAFTAVPPLMVAGLLAVAAFAAAHVALVLVVFLLRAARDTVGALAMHAEI